MLLYSLKELGLNHWKIREKVLAEMKTNAKQSSICTNGLFLFEEAHRIASLRINTFFDNLYPILGNEQQDQEDSIGKEIRTHLKEALSSVSTEVSYGKNFLSGQELSKTKRQSGVDQVEQIKSTLTAYYETDPQELQLLCYDKYTNELEKTEQGIQFCLTFALTDKDYLDRLVSKNWKYLSDRNRMVSAITHVVKQHHSRIDQLFEIEVLARIGVSEIEKQLVDKEIRMASVISQIENHSGHVERLTEFLDFAERLHHEEIGEGEFAYPSAFDGIANALYSSHIGLTDDILELAYESASAKSLDLRIVCASRQDTLKRQDIISWLTKFIKDKHLEIPDKVGQLTIPLRRWLERAESESQIEIASILAQILIEESDDIHIDKLLSVAIKVLEMLPSYQAKMLTRTEKRGDPAIVDLTFFIKHLTNNNDLQTAIMLLSVYGMIHFDSDLSTSLTLAIETVRDIGTVVWSENEINTIFHSLAANDKNSMVQVLFIEQLEEFEKEKINDVIGSFNAFLSIISQVVVNSSLPFMKRFQNVSRQIRDIINIISHTSDTSWMLYACSIKEDAIEPLVAILNLEENPEAIAFSFVISSMTDCQELAFEYAKSLLESHVFSDELVLTILRFWNILDSSEDLFPRTIQHKVFKDILVPQTENEETHRLLLDLQEKVCTGIVTYCRSSSKQLKKIVENNNITKLYSFMLQKELPRMKLGMENGIELMRIILWCFIYPFDYNMTRKEEPDGNIIIEGIARLETTTNPNERVAVVYSTMTKLFAGLLRGNPNQSYVTFLLAVVVNNQYLKMNATLLNDVCKDKLIQNDDALEFAVLFNFLHQDGQKPDALTYSELTEAMEDRKKLKEQSSDRLDWSTSLDELKLQISDNTRWVDRLQFLSIEQRKIRDAHSRIDDLKTELRKEGDIANDARTLANNLLTLSIADERMIEFISRRSYNYFLLAWETPRSKTAGKDAVTLGKKINKWLDDREPFFGYTIKLTGSTRVGKIPLGMTFDEFKRFIGRDLMELREKLGKKPNIFIVCWSPSTYSAHALSGEETLDMNPIESLRTTFRKLDLNQVDVIDKFIDRQFFGPRSMEDAMTALNESSASIMNLWEDEPIDFMIRFAILTDELRSFIKNRKEQMTKLYRAMKGNKSLHNFAMIDAEKVAERYVGDAFKYYDSKVKDTAVEVARKIIYTLKLVLVLDLKPKNDIKEESD